MRPVLWAGAALVVLIAATLAIGAARSPATYPPDSPEAAVQAYAQAVIDGDVDEARSRLSPDLAARCDEDDFENAFVPESVRITLDDTTIDGDEADVAVTVRPSDDPFDSTSYRERFDLRRIDGEWLIDDDPWPVYFCENR